MDILTSRLATGWRSALLGVIKQLVVHPDEVQILVLAETDARWPSSGVRFEVVVNQVDTPRIIGREHAMIRLLNTIVHCWAARHNLTARVVLNGAHPTPQGDVEHGRH